MKKLMIAAPRSGSGKTLITCGLLRLLLRKGFHPAAFKCGPDFIDPMFHRRVLGIPGTNLDSYFLGEEDVRALFRRTIRRENADFALIEGVMGYYDGIAVRGGLHCAPSIHAWLGTAGAVRASLGPFSTEGDVDALLSAVGRMAK